ncbi:MAG: twin transmembrane helix small protein [Steroidobacteraceae bacterium]
MQGILRLVIILAFLAVVVSLGSALYHLARGSGAEDSRKMARALTVRIVLSLLLFFLIMAAWWAGLIAPHGFQPR